MRRVGELSVGAMSKGRVRETSFDLFIDDGQAGGRRCFVQGISLQR